MKLSIQGQIVNNLKSQIEAVATETLKTSLNGAVSIGVKEAEINEDGHLIITFTNSTQKDLGNVVGEKGDDGVGIEDIFLVEQIEDGSSVYCIKTTDGESYNITIPKGEKGSSGQAATIRIGSVITGESDTEAQVTNSGTESDVVLDFVIPKGRDGRGGGSSGGIDSTLYRTAEDQDVIDATKITDVEVNGSSVVTDNVAHIIINAYSKEETDTALSTKVGLSGDEVIEGQKNFKLMPKIYVPAEDGHGLPEEYKELRYIATTGSQYINCGYTPTSSNLKFDMEVSCTSQTANRNFICCCGNTSVGHYCEILPNGCFGMRISGVDYSTGVFCTPFEKYQVVMEKVSNKISVTVGNKTVSSTAAQSANNLTPIYLFRLDSSFLGTSVIFYSCKIYDNNVLVRDFYPCQRVSDLKVGMYDKVNNVFYTNAGSDEFALGGSVEAYYTDLLTSGQLARVAFSGSYNDLLSKPEEHTHGNKAVLDKLSDNYINNLIVAKLKELGLI